MVEGLARPCDRTRGLPSADPKLGLLFLTRGDVNHPDIWREFTSGAGNRVRVLSHPKDISLTSRGFLKGSAVHSSIDTRWGNISIVRAMLALLAEACEDPSLSHFAFVSESCIPVKPWSAVSAAIARDPRPMVDLDPDMKAFHRKRFSDTFGLPWFSWQLHSQWMLLDREAAGCILDQDLTENFAKVFAPDEHYFGTVLALQGFPFSRINARPVTWVDWKRGCPANFQGIDEELKAELSAFPGFFARKFAEGSDIAAAGLHRN